MPIEQNDTTITLKLDSGASVEIYWFGATVTSWKVDGKEKFFLSSKSCLDASKPVSGIEVAEIRGGIPIVFVSSARLHKGWPTPLTAQPIFGAPPAQPAEYAALKQHGYVRSQNWSLQDIIMDRPEGISVRLVPPPPPAEFGHADDYALSYVVTLAPHQLSTDVHVKVPEGAKGSFQFQALLHNYLAVPDVRKIAIQGLGEGVEYTDKILNFKKDKHPGGELRIEGATDRVYQNVPSREITVDDGAGAGFKVRFRGFEDCTIWNPQEGGASIADMEDGGWNRYICIEPGFVRDFKVLQPGEEFIGQQVISLL